MKLLQQLTNNFASTTKTEGHSQLITSSKSQATAAINGSTPVLRSGNKTSLTNVNTDRFEHWSMISQLQFKHSQAEGAERSLVKIYRGLLNVEHTTKNKVRYPQQTADRVRQLEASVSHNLNEALQPKKLYSLVEQKNYKLNTVDLLTPKPAETINLVLPAAGKSVSFHINDYAQPSETLDRINQALSLLNISVSSPDKKSLFFTLPADQHRMLAEPILFSGQGVRIPAGNPVPVKLNAQSRILDDLAKTIEKDHINEINTSVKALKAQTKNTITHVRHFITKIDQEAQLFLPNFNIAPVQAELGEALQQGDFSNRLTILLAQANITRDTTVALLKKNK